MTTYTFTVARYVDVTPDTRCIYFYAPPEFSYLPGQYITLELSINGRIVRRPYSLSSMPLIDPLPFITVKIIENGEVSRFLHQHIQVSDELKAIEANGRFTLPTPPSPQICFLAAGSGISPIFSLIKQSLFKTSSQVILIYSNRSEEQTIFREELMALQAQFAERFQVVWLFSNHKNLLKARLSRFLLEDLMKQYYPELSAVSFFTCGPFVYMEMIFITLLTMGVKQEQLFKETFTGPDDDDEDDGSLLEDEAHPVYVDATVHLNYRNEAFIFTMRADETLLQAAERNNLSLPYSCRRGMCSTCVCQLTSGQVHLQYNQVLTDKEVSEGRILTCMARATTSNLSLMVD